MYKKRELEILLVENSLIFLTTISCM